MAGKDFYGILGISKNASQDEIKRAFRTLARKYHPDVNPGNPEAEEKFKEINEAFQILSDPDKRSKYDQFGDSAFTGGGFKSTFSFDDLFDDLGFQDIFDMFGGRGGGERDSRGEDIREDLTISLEDAVYGTKKEFTAESPVTCDSCNGTGAKDGKLERCNQCNGEGRIRSRQQFGFASFTRVVLCPHCRGTGKTAKNECPKCGGGGTVRKRRKLSVKIPPGVREHTALRLQGEGIPGFRGEAGDLYVVVHLQDHEFFSVEGDDFMCTVHLPLRTAMLGGEIEIRRFKETLKLKIPQGLSIPTVMKLSGKGMPFLRGDRYGDMYVKLTVDMPKKITIKQSEVIDEIFPDKNGLKIESGFIDKIKDFF